MAPLRLAHEELCAEQLLDPGDPGLLFLFYRARRPDKMTQGFKRRIGLGFPRMDQLRQRFDRSLAVLADELKLPAQDVPELIDGQLLVGPSRGPDALQEAVSPFVGRPAGRADVDQRPQRAFFRPTDLEILFELVMSL